MIEELLVVVWALIVIVWLISENCFRGNEVELTKETPDDREKIETTGCSTEMDSCQRMRYGGKEDEDDEDEDEVDKRRSFPEMNQFNLQQLQLQIKRMECMIKMLLPYKEKSGDNSRPMTSVKTSPNLGPPPSGSGGSGGGPSMRDCFDRLVVLEAEKESLMTENGNQRLKFERCLDEVAVHVAHVLLAQQTLRGECFQLHQRVLRLEHQNEQLQHFFQQQQLQSLSAENTDQFPTSPDHNYEVPEYSRECLVGDVNQSLTDQIPIVSPMIYDSIENSFQSLYPISTTSTQNLFNVRSQTVPPYTGSRRTQTGSPSCARSSRRSLDDFLLCGGNRRIPKSRPPDSKYELLASGFERVHDDDDDDGWKSKRISNRRLRKDEVKIVSGDETLAASESRCSNSFAMKAIEDVESSDGSVSDDDADDASPGVELLRLSDSFYERFTIDEPDGMPSLSKRGGNERRRRVEIEYSTSDDDDERSAIADPATTSSVSLNDILEGGGSRELLTTTLDSDDLSVVDYPRLDEDDGGCMRRFVRSATASTDSDSDYEELLIDAGAPPPPSSNLLPVASSKSPYETTPPGARKSNECRIADETHSVGKMHRIVGLPLFNALSRCSNEKLKIAADKIFSVGCRVRTVRTNAERYDDGSVERIGRTDSREPVQHIRNDDGGLVFPNRPSFIQLSNPSNQSTSSVVLDELNGVPASSCDQFRNKGRFSPLDGEPPISSDDYVNLCPVDVKPTIPVGPLLLRHKLKQSPNATCQNVCMQSATCQNVCQQSATCRNISKPSATCQNVCQQSAMCRNVSKQSATCQNVCKPSATCQNICQQSATCRNVSKLSATCQNVCKRSSANLTEKGIIRRVFCGLRKESGKDSDEEEAGRVRRRSTFDGRTLSNDGGQDSSADESDVQPSFVSSSSSDNETITGEKQLPSSQDDGYSSNSLPGTAARNREAVSSE